MVSGSRVEKNERGVSPRTTKHYCETTGNGSSSSGLGTIFEVYEFWWWPPDTTRRKTENALSPLKPTGA